MVSALVPFLPLSNCRNALHTFVARSIPCLMKMLYAILAEDGPLTRWKSFLGWKRGAQKEPGPKWLTETENLRALKVADQLAQLLSELRVSWDGAFGGVL